MSQLLCHEHVWLDKCKYDDAERIFYENKAKDIQTPLAAEVGRAREWLTNIKNCIEEPKQIQSEPDNSKLNAVSLLEERVLQISQVCVMFENKLDDLLERVKNLEGRTEAVASCKKPANVVVKPVVKEEAKPVAKDDDVDLFGSDSEEDAEASEIREKRLNAYAAKKSKKPTLIAKSNIILDVKPWDDETDMKQMEKVVRNIKTAGLVWGASKLVPLAYGIYKLQISCVVEDEIVSVDWLQEQIEALEDFVQSVDIAAFNKV